MARALSAALLAAAACLGAQLRTPTAAAEAWAFAAARLGAGPAGPPLPAAPALGRAEGSSVAMRGLLGLFGRAPAPQPWYSQLWGSSSAPVLSLALGVLLGAMAAARGRGGASAPTYIFNSSIAKEQVLEAQKAWGDGIVKISAAHANGEDFTFLAKEHIRNLYGYGVTDVLFKPTLASEIQFRSTFDEALSYFVATNGVCSEDSGFAIKGWKAVRWENVDITTSGNTAMAMGNYFFTTPEGGEVKVEYTFGYFLDGEGKVRINLHHSSVPYDSGVTKEEVIAVQTAWAGAIKHISKVYKDKGDYVQAAAEAAGELYAYGKGNVLFKPTKAREYPFRPTAEEAMSYFVGNDAVENGYKEDGGFAINGGKGFSDCLYKNHQIELKGGIGIAMGTYDFTCATTGDVSTVEYTFGYKRCDDGKVRIFLHHSSVPYSA
ncbi:unnamed protein product [Prorocentrum cordatum]|uniref:Phosphoribosyl-AMP cyclohydrolase n=1 Tax=Prorocentrum cordatum TaxID=2364126 RepID=A0ABN9RYV1_9DINO|nr:unnamed protein product [Polarella glacialis]